MVDYYEEDPSGRRCARYAAPRYAFGKESPRPFISDLVLQILAFVAENERTYILERQREGIEAAKRRGVKFGRRKRKLPANFIHCVALWRRKEMTLAEAARLVNIPRTTFRTRAKELLLKDS